MLLRGVRLECKCLQDDVVVMVVVLVLVQVLVLKVMLVMVMVVVVVMAMYWTVVSSNRLLHNNILGIGGFPHTGNGLSLLQQTGGER